MTWDHFLRPVSVASWIICLAALSPAVGRLLLRTGRHLDPIWAIVFLLAVNRLSFLLRVSSEGSHATAAMLALGMAYAATWYQRRDA